MVDHERTSLETQSERTYYKVVLALRGKVTGCMALTCKHPGKHNRHCTTKSEDNVGSCNTAGPETSPREQGVISKNVPPRGSPGNIYINLSRVLLLPVRLLARNNPHKPAF